MGRSKKDSEENAPRPTNRPDPSRPRPQATRPTSWEDELRRLLDGQTQAAPPATPPRQPPVLTQQGSRIVTTPTASQPPVARPALVNLPQRRPEPAPAMSPIEVSARALAPLSQSQEAYARASQIDKTAAARIEKVPGQHVQATRVIRRAASPEVIEAILLFKNAKAARQAVMASVVFGPPRAFEEQTSTNF